MSKPQAKKRTKKVVLPIPGGFPAVGSYVKFYDNGWRHGRMDYAYNNVVKIHRPGKRDLKLVFADVEIPEDGVQIAEGPTV